jgi:ADP-ribose pyrophosphatase YjhB (NUDIX family)
VEPDETLAEAACREVREETGLAVRVMGETEVFELSAEGHAYAVHEHLCVPVDPAAPLRPGDDAAEARWAAPEELDALCVTADAQGVIRRAAEVFDKTVP